MQFIRIIFFVIKKTKNVRYQKSSIDHISFYGNEIKNQVNLFIFKGLDFHCSLFFLILEMK